MMQMTNSMDMSCKVQYRSVAQGLGVLGYGILLFMWGVCYGALQENDKVSKRKTLEPSRKRRHSSSTSSSFEAGYKLPFWTLGSHHSLMHCWENFKKVVV